jgi:hypothetical protein
MRPVGHRGLRRTSCVYGFELQVSKPTASTLVTVSWFIPVLGIVLAFFRIVGFGYDKKKNLIKTWFLSKFLNYFLQRCDRLYFFIKKI